VLCASRPAVGDDGPWIGVRVALAAYGMPVQLTVMSTLFGAAFGLFPIA
jgi:hypothetical protein